MYILDTMTASAIIKKVPSKVPQKMRRIPDSEVHYSVITEAELLFGLKKKPEATKLAEDVRTFLGNFRRLNVTRSTAEAYGELRAHTQQAGIIIQAMDLLIASHAYEHDAVLVTNDGALKKIDTWVNIEDWILP